MGSAWRTLYSTRGSMASAWPRCWWNSVWTLSGSEASPRRGSFACRDKPTLSKICRILLIVERNPYLTGELTSPDSVYGVCVIRKICQDCPCSDNPSLQVLSIPSFSLLKVLMELSPAWWWVWRPLFSSEVDQELIDLCGAPSVFQLKHS